jgi:hypothetical protein
VTGDFVKGDFVTDDLVIGRRLGKARPSVFLKDSP